MIMKTHESLLENRLLLSLFQVVVLTGLMFGGRTAELGEFKHSSIKIK